MQKKQGLKMSSCFLTRSMCRFPRIVYSLPFIRNHDFTRNSTKDWIFKDFRMFSKAFYKRLKKETVNLRIENAILCLKFALVHFILTNHFCSGRLFLWLQRRTFWGVKEKSGVGPKGPGHFYATYRGGLWGHPYKFSSPPNGRRKASAISCTPSRKP